MITEIDGTSRMRILERMQLCDEKHTSCGRANLIRSRYLYKVQGKGDRFPHPRHHRLRTIKKGIKNRIFREKKYCASAIRI